MKQRVIKGQEIFSEISKSLKEAKREILVVVAWFTDQELLSILTEKLKENVAVKIVIGKNKDNEKLDFSRFQSLGGSLKRVKGKGFGMMHEKYCVIDRKEAFHGSYNWTINAKKNNSESVIVTNHGETVRNLIENFNETNIFKKDNKMGWDFKKLFRRNKNNESEKEEVEEINDNSENGGFRDENLEKLSGLDEIIEYAQKDFESGGYNDALMNPDSSHKRESIALLIEDLHIKIDKAKKKYEEDIINLEIKIERLNNAGLTDTAKEREGEKEKVLNDKKNVLKHEEEASKGEGYAVRIRLSYSRGFDRGLVSLYK